MKRYTAFIEGKSYTPERLERACKFLSEALKIEKTYSEDIKLSILFTEGKENEILALAEKYGIVDYTK